MVSLVEAEKPCLGRKIGLAKALGKKSLGWSYEKEPAFNWDAVKDPS
jgi:hypothetical protein